MKSRLSNYNTALRTATFATLASSARCSSYLSAVSSVIPATRFYTTTSGGHTLFLEAEDLMKNRAAFKVLDTRSPKDFEEGHIPSAVNAHDVFTYLLPSSSDKDIAAMRNHFQNVFENIGLNRSDDLVVTERGLTRGFGQSCRSWFLLRLLGHPKVRVLDGGIEAWVAAGGSLEKGAPATVKKSVYQVTPDSSLLATTEEVLAVLQGKSKAKLLDVRDKPEWIGVSSSPYGADFCPRKGRIPGTVWAEWYNFMHETDSSSPNKSVCPKSPDQVRSMMRQLGVAPSDEVIVYCFKGSRASNTMMILKESGFNNVKNYFGSWNEWSRDPKLPIDSEVLTL